MADEFVTAAIYGIKRFNEGVKRLIGMEKLIELLNEYRKEKGERNLNEYEVSQTLDSLNYLKLFIKWLVEKEKIDFYTILKENGTFRKEFYAIENRKEYERLIMLLSVEDEPISFLISILK